MGCAQGATSLLLGEGNGWGLGSSAAHSGPFPGSPRAASAQRAKSRSPTNCLPGGWSPGAGESGAARAAPIPATARSPALWASGWVPCFCQVWREPSGLAGGALVRQAPGCLAADTAVHGGICRSLSRGRWAAGELSVCGGRGAIGTPSRRSVGAGEAGRRGEQGVLGERGLGPQRLWVWGEARGGALEARDTCHHWLGGPRQVYPLPGPQ